MWIIASVPFWLLGAFLLYGVFHVVPLRKPDESTAELAGQIVVGLIGSGASMCLAAWIAS